MRKNHPKSFESDIIIELINTSEGYKGIRLHGRKKFVSGDPVLLKRIYVEL